MAKGRPLSPLSLSAEDRAQLVAWSKRPKTAQALAMRSRVVLLAAGGHSNTAIAGQLLVTLHTVGKWRQRFVEHRLAGLYDELRPGRPRSIKDEQIAALLKRTLSRKPAAGTHWSIRQAAQVSGISRSTVHRLFQAFALQPHRSRSFKLSSDPVRLDILRRHQPHLVTLLSQSPP